MNAGRSREAAAKWVIPNILHPYYVFYTDHFPLPVVAWHQDGYPMVVDSARGLLVQAHVIDTVEKVDFLTS